MKIVSILSLFILTCSCQEVQNPVELGDCWSLQKIDAGPVQGTGILTVSMEGYSLLAPTCGSRFDQNYFTLDENMRIKLIEFSGKNLSKKTNFIAIRFVGIVDQKGDGKYLIISDLPQIRYTDKPEWIRGLELR